MKANALDALQLSATTFSQCSTKFDHSILRAKTIHSCFSGLRIVYSISDQGHLLLGLASMDQPRCKFAFTNVMELQTKH